MKRSWRKWNRLGVTAVGGTAATLGITVILAALLYGIANDMSGDVEQPTFGAFVKTTTVEAGEYKLGLGTFVPSPQFTSCKVVIISPDGTIYRWEIVDDGEGPTAIEDNTTNDGVTLKVVDLGGDSKVGMGDYLLLKFDGAMEKGTWTVSMLLRSSGSVIASTNLRA
jgi:hypothetical protein